VITQGCDPVVVADDGKVNLLRSQIGFIALWLLWILRSVKNISIILRHTISHDKFIHLILVYWTLATPGKCLSWLQTILNTMVLAGENFPRDPFAQGETCGY
jgi:hypothetical protein